MFEYNQKILENGLRVVFVPMDLTSVVVSLSVGAGGKNEKKNEHGLAHFLEHMAFKGTKKRPDKMAMAKELDKIGAIYNASTSKEKTTYWIKNTSRHLNLMTDIVSDIVFNSQLKEKEIGREKGVILEEINMYEDTPVEKVDDLFFQQVMGNNLLGRSLLGTKKSVQSFDRDDFLNYKQRLYSPKNMVLAFAGKSDKQEIFDLSEKWFGDFRSFQASEERISWRSEPEKIFIEQKDTEQTHLVLGCPIFGLKDSRRWPMSVLKTVLATGMSSRMWNEIREKRGLAYYVYSMVSYFQEAGLFAIKAGVRNDQVQEAVGVIKKELTNIGETMTNEEFQDAKEGIRGRILLSLESTNNLAEWAADTWLREGKIRTVKETLELIDSVKIEQVRDLAEEYFQSGKLYLAAIGPIDNFTI